jgi:hypothetical protein
MRTYLKRLLLFALPLLAVLTGVNYFGDAGDVFSDTLEQEIAAIHVSGQHATRVREFDDRRLRALQIQHLTTSPDQLIMGSSRSLLFGAKAPDANTLNLSVSAVALEDMEALSQLLFEHNQHPEKLILSIDPWLFNAHIEVIRWRTLNSALHRYHNQSEPIFPNLWKLEALFSLDYFKSSWEMLQFKFNDPMHPVASATKENKWKTWCANGSVVESATIRMQADSVTRQKVYYFTRETPLGFADYRKLSEERISRLSTLITAWQSRGTEVVLYLPPYHPDAYAHLQTNYPQVQRAEEVVIALAKQHGCSIRGSYDPSPLGLNSSDFHGALYLRTQLSAKD